MIIALLILWNLAAAEGGERAQPAPDRPRFALASSPRLSQAPRAKDENLKAEKKRLEGRWRIVAAEQGGKKMDSQDVVVFSGDKCIVTNPSLPVPLESTFTLDPTKKPRWMDVTGPQATGGMTWLGIYEWKGDTLRAVFQGDKNGQRPTEFRTHKGSQEVMYTYKRVPR